MGIITRGIKNIYRNKIRNIAVILMLTLSLSFALMMINMDFSSNQRVKIIKERLGTSFSVTVNYEYIEELAKKEGDKIYNNPELFLIDESLAEDILKVDSVKSVTKSIIGNFFSKKLKQRTVALGTGVIEHLGGIEEIIKVYDEMSDLEDPILLTGIEDMDMQKWNERYKFVKGNFFKSSDIEQNVAVITDGFAKRNNLDVGSNMVINREKIKVCGIFKDKNKFYIEAIATPFKTAQRLLGLEGKVSSLFVTVDSLDNVDKTINYINNTLSDGKIDVIRNEAYEIMLLTINRIKRISKVGMISSFIIGTLVILLIMFIHVRERAREIGILKAIGASNINISAQFLVESITLCTIALILGVVIILSTNQLITVFIFERERFSVLKLENEALFKFEELIESKDIEEIPKEVKEEIMNFKEASNLINLKIAFSPQILILAILLTFLLAAIGSIIPAYYISKLRPAEVLRFG